MDNCVVSDPVPSRFRPVIEVVVWRMADGDWDGLVQDGYAPRNNSGAELSYWVQQYPGRLVPLPPEAWDESDHGRVEIEDGRWWVVVPLWTQGEGRSDLSLEATIRERPGQISVEIDNIHVL